jgi:hypothetical protein
MIDGTNASNAATIFVVMKPWEERFFQIASHLQLRCLGLITSSKIHGGRRFLKS